MNDISAQMQNTPSDQSQVTQEKQPPETYADDYQPPTDAPSSESDSSNQDESLEVQNIFFMLGVEDGNEQLRDGFLNELQDVIWDDFLENDVNMLITSDEKVKFDSLMEKRKQVEGGKSDEEIQDALVVYLESLIPDLEEIMLEKALDLKSDLFVERIASLREYHSGNEENQKTIREAERLMHEDRWHSAAELLNGLT